MTHLEQFAAQAPQTLAGEHLNWLREKRTAAVARFNTAGIPTTKDEDWKYTNLRSLTSTPFNVASEQVEDIPDLAVNNLNSHRLVFINGVFQAVHSDLAALPQGVIACSMTQALQTHTDKVSRWFAQVLPQQENAFASLNSAWFTDGAFIHVAQDVSVEKPLELIFYASGEQTLNLPRNLVLFEQGAQATVVERHYCAAASNALTNSATEIHLDKAAQCDFYLLQTATEKARQIGGTWVHQEQGSRFSARTITLGGQLVRNELKVTLAGEQAHTDCIGLFIGGGRQHIDNHTTIRHAAPHCTSREIYKGILDDRARGVFHGRVVVDQDAQQTFAEQQSANLLLSRNAEIDTKPQLEIYADDVKCSHGATVGELDENQIFYLQSRGLDRPSARTLLTYAFAAEVLEEIELAPLKNELRQSIAKNMHIEGIS